MKITSSIITLQPTTICSVTQWTVDNWVQILLAVVGFIGTVIGYCMLHRNSKSGHLISTSLPQSFPPGQWLRLVNQPLQINNWRPSQNETQAPD